MYVTLKLLRCSLLLVVLATAEYVMPADHKKKEHCVNGFCDCSTLICFKRHQQKLVKVEPRRFNRDLYDDGMVDINSHPFEKSVKDHAYYDPTDPADVAMRKVTLEVLNSKRSSPALKQSAEQEPLLAPVALTRQSAQRRNAALPTQSLSNISDQLDSLSDFFASGSEDYNNFLNDL